MTKRNEADRGSLSFKDRSLSNTAAKELFDTKAASALGGIIDTAVVRIKLAKTTKAEKATDAYFAHRTSKQIFTHTRDARTGQVFANVSGRSTKPREIA